MRLHSLAAVCLLVSATAATAAPPDYYGPMNWGQGYKDEVTKDGYWKIQTGTHRGRMLAIDAAIYRAAELARAAACLMSRTTAASA